MALMTGLLYPSPRESTSAVATVSWWEKRRLQFNAVVGATGLFTLASVYLIAAIPPGIPRFSVAPIAVVIYAAIANLCFTLGAPGELLLQRILKRDARELGPMLFRQGMIFSVGLTLLPIIMIGLAWVRGLVLAMLKV